MFFTKAGLAIAWLLFVPSAASFGLITVSLWTGKQDYIIEVFGEQFFASASTFVQGIAIAVAFGIAAEISKAVAARSVQR